jgi:phosphomannomutase
MKETMKKEDALFGSELSGHFYFKNSYFMDADILPFLYFLQFLAESTKTSDELLGELEVYSTSGELSFSITPTRNETILEGISVHFKDAKETKWIDGLSIYYDDWWANIRQSHTETTPVMRLIVEARTKELLDQKVAELKKLIEV